MKFYPRTEFQCATCGHVVWSHVLSEPGQVLARCTNRGCEQHGKRFVIQVAPVEGQLEDQGKLDL